MTQLNMAKSKAYEGASGSCLATEHSQESREKPSKQEKTNKLNSYDTGSGNWTWVQSGERRVLSPLHHLVCSPKSVVLLVL